MLLTLNDIGKSFGAERIFEHISAAVNEQDRIALIGPNGAGKTTLLNIIAGFEDPDEGSVARAGTLNVGYLRQNGGLSADGTIESEMKRALQEVYAVEQAMLATGEQMAGEQHGTARYAQLEQEYQSQEAKFISLDGYHAAVKISTVLNGMGFGSFERATPVASMSGGERTRLMLAKLLIEAPDILILDEATNHLDFKMLAWLEEYLASYRGAILTVSHDRYFLDRVTNVTWEIENLSLVSYPAPYGRYLALRAERLDRMEKEYEHHIQEVARLQDYADRNMARASTSASAKSRLKMIEHLGEAQKPFVPKKPPLIRFEPKSRPVSDILLARGLTVAVGEGEQRRELLSAADIHIKRGERVAIIGENGAGKSTLLKTLVGKLAPASGELEWGRNVSLSCFEQDSSDLHPDKTALMELWDRFPLSNEHTLRTLLGGLHLEGEEAFKTIGVLSGGERARIKLAIVILEHGNVLVMDEPTNHLDIPAKEALEMALMKFEGTVIVVSHDRYLLSHLPTRILRMADGNLQSFDGGFEEMQAQLALSIPQEKAEDIAETSKAESSAQKAFYRSKAQRSAEVAAKKRLERLEQDIATTEAALEEAQKQLADPEAGTNYERLTELTQRIADLEVELNGYYAEWDQLL
ncbi:MAG: ABC-F family ATP-binding cassette domain-containing protein [Candidatus Fimivivens sp.]|nr:ABC-F family ATP-binding cassette domain-containing protein [Candidatus Fimivivens sp.]